MFSEPALVLLDAAIPPGPREMGGGLSITRNSTEEILVCRSFININYLLILMIPLRTKGCQQLRRCPSTGGWVSVAPLSPTGAVLCLQGRGLSLEEPKPNPEKLQIVPDPGGGFRGALHQAVPREGGWWLLGAPPSPAHPEDIAPSPAERVRHRHLPTCNCRISVTCW